MISKVYWVKKMLSIIGGAEQLGGSSMRYHLGAFSRCARERDATVEREFGVDYNLALRTNGNIDNFTRQVVKVASTVYWLYIYSM